MYPIEFKGFNRTFAKDQPEYLPLPVFLNNEGMVVSCWKLSFKERLKLLFTGKMWFTVLTFNQPLQPQLPAVKCPLLYNKV